MEHDGGVDPVEELGAEEAFDFVHDFFFHPVVAGSRRLSIAALNGEAQGRFPFDQVRPQVAGHHQDRVSEVDPPPTGIGQLSSVEYLQQDIENVWMGLLNLIQQNGAIVLSAHTLG